jgi:hypothetical protein
MAKSLSSFSKAVQVVGLVGVVSFVGCAPLNDPNGYGYGNSGYPYGGPGYGSGPYYGNQPYYGNGYGNNDYYRRERRELEKERERLERERERLERARDNQPQYLPPPMPRPSQERCPPGFSPSERKCSPEERRRGCRDVRLDSGLGCVAR